MAYKKLIKVSNVCQLLDKSKYPATQTVNGVTFTNNGDGSITVNGTATSRAALTFTSFSKSFLSGKFLLIGCPNGGNVSKYFNYVFIRTQDGNFINGVEDVGNGGILNYGITTYTVLCQIIVMKDTVCDNLVFKPQLFDLTEMYGAGNEPTTVEQFRQDFPDEMYDYSPRCWLTSYKRVFMTGGGNYLTSYQRNLTCKTKNLFDNIPVKTNYVINTNGEEVATPGYNVYDKIYGNNFTISTNAPVDLTHSDNWLRVCFYNSSGTFIARRDFDFNTRTVANIADDNIACIQLCLHRTSFPNYKLQVELGSTATDYVPYGHL